MSSSRSLFSALALLLSAKWRSFEQLACCQTLHKRKKNAVNYILLRYVSSAVLTRHCLNSVDHILIPDKGLPVRVVFLIQTAIQFLVQAEQHILADDHVFAKHAISLYAQSMIEAFARYGLSISCVDELLLSTLSRNLFSSLKIQLFASSLVTSRQLPNKIILILGMHRSGTSALAGLLCQAGYKAPYDPLPVNQYNPKGYFESFAVFNQNEKILSELSSSWDDITELPIGWEASAVVEEWRYTFLHALCSSFVGDNYVVLKDPRLCILLEALSPVLECTSMEFRYILQLRHPMEVAHSLESRDSFSIAKSLSLWLKYVLSAVYSTNGYPRIFVDYDSLLASPELILKKCDTYLFRLGSQYSPADTFLEQSLRHFKCLDSASVPQDILDLSVFRSAIEAYTLLANNSSAEISRKSRGRLRSLGLRNSISSFYA